MKRTIKLLAFLACIILFISTLVSCGDGGQELPTPEPEGWKPSGATITVATENSTSIFAPVIGETDKALSEKAMKSLIALLDAKGLKSFISDPVYSSDPATRSELIVGLSDRTVSVKAKEFLDEKSAPTPNDLHWVFYYYDGKLAIIANSAEAYEKAIADISQKYISNGAFSFSDTLKDHGTVTRVAYDAELEELERIEAELLKQERDAILSALMPMYEEQRVLIKTSNSFGTVTENIGTPSWGAAPATPIDEHPRVFITSGDIPLIRERLKEDNATNARFLELLTTELDSGGCLGAPETNFDGRKGLHNYDKQVLEIIQAKALGYLVDGHELFGYQAIYYMKNFLLTLDIQYISSDQCREYGNTMMTAALVYDWCYDLLTEEDKVQLMAGIENRAASGECGYPAYTSTSAYKKKMEVGFPPSGQGSVSGHGSEGQILRNYLAAAIAFYGDNNSWWNYIASRVYNDYVVTRNYYYQSGISQQGTGLYVAARHTADLFSAWLLKTGTGSMPYENLDKTMRSFFGYECAPGQIFTDGDGTYETRPISFLSGMAFISAYVFEDPTTLALAENALAGEAFGAETNYLTSVLFVALRGISDVEAAEDRYDDMELIQYNGHPVGQYVIRGAWNSESSAAVFMKIKERNTSNHEHEDAGTFEIYYKGMLTSDGGCYNSYGSEHTAMYHQATISHNGLIIFNSSKWSYSSTDKTKKWYSGSQNAPGEASNLANWLNSAEHETGTVTGRRHAYADEAKTIPLYAYIAGDITKAYPSDTVSHVSRRMLSVYTGDEEFPMAFFVYDKVISSNKKYEKRFLLQITSPDAPIINAKDQTVITENGDGRLVLTCLSDNVVLNGVGGRTYTENGAYSSTLSANYTINGYQDATSGNADDGHWGRVEIVWTKQSNEANFMNAIYVTDKGNENKASIRDTASDNGLSGAIFNKKIAALFATSRTAATETVSCKTFGDAKDTPLSYYVSGVAAGKWSVTVNGVSVGIFEATEEGGLLTFEAPAGDISISPIK